MVFNLSEQNSYANQILAELRSVKVQQDPMRFRLNMERLGGILGYELSKSLEFAPEDVETSLGTATCQIPQDKMVLGTILRAGLPLHRGLLQIFDQAENAFVSAYRKHHKDGSFEINMEYLTCPNLEGKVLVVADAMIATGASMLLVVDSFRRFGTPKAIHFVTAIASKEGLDYLRRNVPKAHFWVGALDEELTAKSYIVPGLGDAGDLAFGAKLQE
jgi:uracil phosphoribosyltransferase